MLFVFCHHYYLLLFLCSVIYYFVCILSEVYSFLSIVENKCLRRNIRVLIAFIRIWHIYCNQLQPAKLSTPEYMVLRVRCAITMELWKMSSDQRSREARPADVRPKRRVQPPAWLEDYDVYLLNYDKTSPAVETTPRPTVTREQYHRIERVAEMTPGYIFWLFNWTQNCIE